MNSSPAAALFLFFLLSANLFSLSTAANEPVLDTDGDELRPNVPYYMLSAAPGTGGGFRLASLLTAGILCPRIVAHNPFTNGDPVFFHPMNTTATVYTSTDLNIRFSGTDQFCRSTNIWRAAPYDGLPGHWWVVNGGDMGNPGAQTLFDWFKIEKLEAGYKLTHCPSVCDSCEALCKNIGKYSYHNMNLLGLTDEDRNAWPFVFVKSPAAIQQVGQKHSE
ncbi:hypothetical protein V6N13_050093 [Hibiscus sabdariffa]|uniref:Uncharacterized protein n=2 Tax=Hibiscus sabdariffa TaxID=183260 RepID=A0ABR1ZBP2_9ROSI